MDESGIATTVEAVLAHGYDGAERREQLAVARRLDAACPRAVFLTEEGRGKAVRLLNAGYHPEEMLGGTWTEGRLLSVTRDREFKPGVPNDPDALFTFRTHYPFAGEAWGIGVGDELDFTMLDSQGLGMCPAVDAWEWFGPDGLDTVVYRAPDFTPPTLAERIDAYLANGWDASALLERAAAAPAR